jgi:hypothetical protein
MSESARTLKEIGCNREGFFPAEIIARGAGVRPGFPQGYFNSSQAHRFGLSITG